MGMLGDSKTTTLPAYMIDQIIFQLFVHELRHAEPASMTCMYVLRCTAVAYVPG